MTDSTHVGEMLFEYLDGELGAEQHGRVETHLEQCLSCRDELELARQFRGAIGDLPEHPLPAGFKERLYAQLPLKNYAALLRPTGVSTGWWEIARQWGASLAAFVRARPRLAWGVGAALLAVVVLYVSLLTAPRSHVLATLYSVGPDNVLRRFEGPGITSGAVWLKEGTVITTDPNSRGVLVIHQQSTVRLDAGSRLTVTRLTRSPRTGLVTAGFHLESGRIWVAKNRQLDCLVATRHATIIPTGTVFELHHQVSGLRVNVWDGQVKIAAAGDPGKVIPLEKGERMTVSQNGDFLLPGTFDLKPSDPFQQWNTEARFEENPPTQPLLSSPEPGIPVYQVGSGAPPPPKESPVTGPTEPFIDAGMLRDYETWERRHPEEAARWKRDHPEIWQAIRRAGQQGPRPPESPSIPGRERQPREPRETPEEWPREREVPRERETPQGGEEHRSPLRVETSVPIPEMSQQLQRLERETPAEADAWKRGHPELWEQIRTWRIERESRPERRDDSRRHRPEDRLAERLPPLPAVELRVPIPEMSEQLAAMERAAPGDAACWKRFYPEFWAAVRCWRAAARPAPGERDPNRQEQDGRPPEPRPLPRGEGEVCSGT